MRKILMVWKKGPYAKATLTLFCLSTVGTITGWAILVLVLILHDSPVAPIVDGAFEMAGALLTLTGGALVLAIYSGQL